VREEQDEVLHRIVGELQALPAVKANATAHVLERIAAQQRAAVAPQPNGAPTLRLDEAAGRPVHTRRVLSLPWAISLAAAATIAGFMIRGIGLPRRGDSPTAVAETPAQSPPGVALVPAAAAASRERDEVAVSTQFVLARRGATRVALVGDFNDWDAHRTPMTRDNGSDLWSVSLPLTPGRHVYAFVVDDSVWTLDPRAARARDADYGRAQSVIVVGRP
jgi:hypothetical protein